MDPFSYDHLQDEIPVLPDSSPASEGSPVPVFSAALATAALVLAVLSVVSVLFIYIAVPLGALSALFALLSRGNLRLFGRARSALRIALCAMAGSVLITGYTFFRIMTDPDLRAQFSRILDYYSTYYFQEEDGSGSLFGGLFDGESGSSGDAAEDTGSGSRDAVPAGSSGPQAKPQLYGGNYT